MKNYSFGFLVVYLFALPFVVSAGGNNSVHFEYVLENPKIFGADSARSWFEIVGLKDKVVQEKINDTLRKAFCAPTQFKERNTSNLSLTTPPQLPGTTDYTFFNGSTYGYGWVRFKDRDSLLRLTEADGYYGSGVNLIGFSTGIAQDKIAYIQIIGAGKFGPAGRPEFTFSLVTGNCLPNKFYLHLDPAKRDSLEALLFRGIIYEPYPKPVGTHDCKFVKAEPLSDTVVITSLTLIAWLEHNAESIIVISRNYKISCLMSDDQSRTHTTCNFLRIEESIPFLVQDEWQRLQEIYK